MTPPITPQELHIPRGSISLDQLTSAPQIRLGIQGPPGVGKTFAALTFPNPIVLNYDRGLGAHIGRKDVLEVPFYNEKFVDSIIGRTKSSAPPNRKDATLKWLREEGSKLTTGQTLVIDGMTGLQNAFEAEYNVSPVITRGVVDNFAPWRQKIDYFSELCEYLKSLQCNVVFICHETPDRDNKGELNGKVRPLMSGQFCDQLASHFTDFFRALAFAQPTKEKEETAKTFFGLDSSGLSEWKSKSPAQTFYVWQCASDELAQSCKTSTLMGAPKYILAQYSSFEKHKRKTISP